MQKQYNFHTEPYLGIALFYEVKRENRFLHQKWKLYDALHPVIKLGHLTPAKEHNLLIKTYKKLYLNRARIFRFSVDHKNECVIPKKPLTEKMGSFIKALHFFLLLFATK